MQELGGTSLVPERDAERLGQDLVLERLEVDAVGGQVVRDGRAPAVVELARQVMDLDHVSAGTRCRAVHDRAELAQVSPAVALEEGSDAGCDARW